MGCPVGSLLLGSNDLIEKARRFRKVMGGGWRQAGYLAAAGIYALDNNIQRIKEDHKRAKIIGEILSRKNYVKEIFPIETNIVIFELPENILAKDYVSKMAEHNLLSIAFDKHAVRFVTHLDITDKHIEQFEKIINSVTIF